MLSFINQLRQAEIPISLRHVLEFYQALNKGLAPDLDRLFLLARLVFIKRVEHYDAFERVFAAFFLGQKPPGTALDWEDALAGKPFEDWLREQVASGAMTPEEIRSFSPEELLKRFWETVLAQKGKHRGGNTWVGTHGRSPFGHSGKAGGGVRVHGQSLYGTAQKVIGQRNYVSYDERSALAQENLRQTLASLRNLQFAGPETELDIDATIERTAKNGGEIELVFTRELRDRLKVIVLLDNGGYSMMPFVKLVKTVFGKIREQFRELKYYYFHNCIYGTVFRDVYRSQPLPWDQLLMQGPETRLIIIGDANMASSELMAANGSLYFHTEDRRPGVEWLKELRAAFPASVWLNPLTKEWWPKESSTVMRIGEIFPMEELTLSGIKNAVAYLNLHGKRK
ncbi:MAG: hypothetical protein LLG06_03505 [Desulfobacteraceae bacterium]|nr:hypothetical protein [Desulfobacteraceae bacterium]